MENGNIKLSKLKIALLGFLFVVMFSFAYFLLYAPIKVNDNQLLIITMVFTTFVVAIPLYVFMEDEKKVETLINTKKRKNKKNKSSNKS